MQNRLYGLYNPYHFTVVEDVPLLTMKEYDEKSTKDSKTKQKAEHWKKIKSNITRILHGAVRQCFDYTVKIFLSLLALSDSRHHCNFSPNLSGPLVNTQTKIDNRRKTIQEGSVVLFSVLSVFF